MGMSMLGEPPSGLGTARYYYIIREEKKILTLKLEPTQKQYTR